MTAMHKVYILKSVSKNRYYVGCTEDLSRRLKNHNEGQVRSTKAYCPWTVVYTEDFSDKQTAFKREKQIKAYKGGVAFKKLLEERC